MHCLLERMLEERDDFYTYLEMCDEECDPALHMIFRKIAADELAHFKHLYDIEFKEGTSKMSRLEKEMYDYITEEYQEMTRKIADVK